MSPEANVVDTVIDAVSAVFMVVGALMSLAAAIGLLRFPDLMSRMHAATKPQVLGLFLLLAAVGLQLRTWWVWPVLLVAWIFQLLTVPVSAHMVGRAGYRTKHLHKELLSTDELEAAVVKAAKAARDRKRRRTTAATVPPVDGQKTGDYFRPPAGCSGWRGRGWRGRMWPLRRQDGRTLCPVRRPHPAPPRRPSRCINAASRERLHRLKEGAGPAHVAFRLCLGRAIGPRMRSSLLGRR